MLNCVGCSRSDGLYRRGRGAEARRTVPADVAEETSEAVSEPARVLPEESRRAHSQGQRSRGQSARADRVCFLTSENTPCFYYLCLLRGFKISQKLMIRSLAVLSVVAPLHPPVRPSGIHCWTIFAIRLSDRTSFNEN